MAIAYNPAFQGGQFFGAPGEGKVVVNGSKEYEGMIEGRLIVYI